MSESIDAGSLARLITRNTPDADRQLAEVMQLPGAGSAIEKLLEWPDPAVRFWALDAARRILPRAEFINVLKRAARDRDHAVRTDAIADLVDLEPQYVSKSIGSLEARLSTSIPSGERVFVLWTLAKLKATRAVPQIQALRASEPEWTKLARVADVVLMYLKEGAQPALDLIANHGDHARIEELSTLAWHVIKTPEAERVLAACANGAPDDMCRDACQHGLQRFASSD